MLRDGDTSRFGPAIQVLPTDILSFRFIAVVVFIIFLCFFLFCIQKLLYVIYITYVIHMSF